MSCYLDDGNKNNCFGCEACVQICPKGAISMVEDEEGFRYPKIDEKNYAGKIFTGLLGVFNTKKFSDIIVTFINAAIYFVSLSIIISICSILFTLLISVNNNGGFDTGSAMTVLITGCLVLYLADKADEFATQLGGKIDNSFGNQLQTDTKNMWGSIKGFSGKVIKAWSKDKL